MAGIVQAIVISISTVLLCCTLNYSLGTQSQTTKPTIIKPTNGSLEALLCNGTLSPLTTIPLEPNVIYTITHNRFCVVENLTSLIIRGESSESPSLIQCVRQNSTSIVSSGFGFVNINFMTIENVRVENCGGVVNKAAVRGINDSFFYFGPGQAAVFLFNHCFDLLVKNVVITNYTGYAVIGYNLFSRETDEVKVQNVNVSHSVLYNDSNTLRSSFDDLKYLCVGSGMLFVYAESRGVVPWVPLNTSLGISGCTFIHNYNRDPFLTLPPIVANQTAPKLPLTGAGALSIIYMQMNVVIVTNVSDSNFTRNSGDAYGATVVLYLNTPLTGFAHFTDCMFVGGNSFAKKYSGVDLAVYFNLSSPSQGKPSLNEMDCLRVQRSHFVRGSLYSVHAHMALVQLSGTPETSDVTLEDVHCRGELEPSEALYGCVFGFSLDSTNNLNVHMIDVSSNEKWGAFEFNNLGYVKIYGKSENLSVFQGAYTSLLSAYNTDVYLRGNITFCNNHATFGSGGGAIHLEADSYLYFEEPLNLVFENNSAVYGGAISAIESNAPFCIFQYVTKGVVTCEETCTPMLNINVTFINNTAELAGSSVYADPMYNCDLTPTSNVTVAHENLPKLYDQIFYFPDEPLCSDIAEVSSSAHNICVCDSNGRCNRNASHLSPVSAFLGKVISVWMQPIDANNTGVYSIVSSSTSSDWDLPNDQEIFQLNGEKCQQVNFTIINRKTMATNGKIANLKAMNGNITIEPVNGKPIGPGANILTFIPFNIIPCPLGFLENKKSGICECARMLQKHGVTCYTHTGLTDLPGASWVGPLDTVKLGFSATCPEGYCKSHSGDAINVSDDRAICLHRRCGVLCGECPGHLSVVFGSNRCLPCSDTWLATIALYAIVGFLLVALLFLLRLSVATGSLNGLIFYGNILSTNMFIFLDYEPLYWLLNFVANVNLDLGFPLCFYRGMNEISKAYFQFLFPLYLWFIAGGVVVASKYSVVVSRMVSRSSVPVLATVIHISFSKLTRAAFEGLTPADVEVEDENGTTSSITVWYFDGNVRYGGSEHIGLFIISVLVVLFFVIPYTTALVVAPFLLRFRIVNNIKPLIDAYTGPYKDTRRYWFGFRVSILLLIFIIYEFLKGRNNALLLYIESLILAVFTVVQLSANPYKNKVIDILDTFFLANCFLLTSYGAFLHAPAGSQALHIGAGILVGSVFVVFLGVIVYHIWLVIPKQWYGKKRVESISVTIADYEVIPGSDDYTIHSDSQLREPLLEDGCN